MSSRNSCIAIICLGMLIGVVSAQEPGEPPPANASGETTLPEIVVQPESEPSADPAAASPDRSDPYDLPLSYPSLSQLEFEGLGSALRSTRSIFDSPRATSIIDSKSLDERQPRNMVEAVEREVGVLIQRTGAGQASPFIRGLTGPQTLILIDGIRLNNSTFRFGPNQYFATIDPGIIERIEVVRGPQSVLWGSDAIGGVINVVTRSIDPRFCNFAGGQFIERFATADNGSYSRVNVEGSYNRLGVFGGGSYLNVNDLRRGDDLGKQPLTNYSQYAGDLRFDMPVNSDQLLTVALQHVEQEDVPRSDKWPKEIRLFNPQQRNLGYLRWQGNNAGGAIDTFMLTASYGRQKEGTFRRKPPTGANVDLSEFNVNTVGLSLLLGADLDRLGRLTWGADWYHDHVTAHSNRYDFATGALIAPLIPQYPDKSYYERFGTFLQWEADLTARLSATAGVRYTNVDLGSNVALIDPANPGNSPVDTQIYPNFQDWTASIGLTYEINPCLHLVGSIAEGFRAPSLDELTSVSDNVNEGIDIPNPALSPETSISYEIGLKLNYDRIRAQTFVFWNELDDLLVRQKVNEIPDPVDAGSTIDVLQRRNLGSAQVQGFELAGEFLLTPEWSCYGNFTYLYGQNFSDGKPLSRIPPTQGVIGLRWRDQCARRWLDVYGWLVAEQSRLSSRDTRDSRIPAGGTPGYGTANVRLGSCVGRHQRITLGIENIFNTAYRVHGSGVDGPGISGQFGYELAY